MVKQDKSTETPERLSGSGQAAEASNGQGRGLAARESAAEEAIRAEMARTVDRELAELNRQLDAHRATGGPASDPHRAALEQKAGDLHALRGRIETAPSLAALALLRSQVSEQVRHTGEAIQAAGSALSVSAGAAAGQRMAEAVYHTQMSAVERSMSPILREDRAGFARTESLADRFGVDIGGFREARHTLDAVAEDARRKNDRTTAVMADALGVRAGALAAEKVADGIDGDTQPAAKAQAQKEAEAARNRADQAEKQARLAVEAEAGREAAAAEAKGQVRFGSDDERKAWIKGQADRRMQGFDDAKQTLIQKGSISAAEATEKLSSWKQAMEKSEAVQGRGASSTPGATPSTDATQTSAQVAAALQTTSADMATAAFGEAPATPPKTQIAGLTPTIQEAARKAAAPAVAAGAAETSVKDESAPQAPRPIATAEAGRSKGGVAI